jgi:clan AA aspartic protease (TIGR02281 family)
MHIKPYTHFYALIPGGILTGLLLVSVAWGSYLLGLDGVKKTTPMLMAASAPSRDFAAVSQTRSPFMEPLQETAPLNPVRVPLHPDDRALMLTAVVDHYIQAPFILDTGATYTTISTDLARRLGYQPSMAQHIKITTANGEIMLPRVVLKSLTLNGYTAYNVEATVMTMPTNVPFAGLLGMSFIRHHRITIDADAAHLVIEPQR